MPRLGPSGLEFARARVEMKATETIVHLRREEPQRIRLMVPPHVWQLVAPYGLVPAPGEQPADRTSALPERQNTACQRNSSARPSPTG